jgi:hypothetical protein
MKDPLFVMTEHINRLNDEITQLKAEIQKWKNITGIMHEALREGDPDGARLHYEENADVS